MYTFDTNWMGPINSDWVREHGECWSGGRIDVYGGEPYEEISLPVMRTEDWNSFSEWLWDFQSERGCTLKQLVSLYEENHPKIRWFDENEFLRVS